jgi:hypothetical protein
MPSLIKQIYSTGLFFKYISGAFLTYTGSYPDDVAKMAKEKEIMEVSKTKTVGWQVEKLTGLVEEWFKLHHRQALDPKHKASV